MNTKKVLIITYYWPPSGGAGVKRALFFAKYLREFGWTPIIYTVKNGDYPAEDLSLLKDIPKDIKIIKQPIWEPYDIYRVLLGKKKQEKLQNGIMMVTQKRNHLHRISSWIRANFFIPDARKYWIKPSIEFLTNYLKENPVDLIFSTSPPNTVQMIADGVKKNTGTPWLADFRDPWTQIYYFKQLSFTKRALRAHYQMEKMVLDNADLVTVVTPGLKAYFSTVTSTNIEILTNGFDVPESNKSILPIPHKFSIAFVGELYEKRIPKTFFKTLSNYINENPNLKEKLVIKIIGVVDDFCTHFFKDLGFNDQVIQTGYLNFHDMYKAIKESQIVLSFGLKDTKEVIPSKLFDAIGAGRPVIHLGPVDGDAIKVIEQLNAGKYTDYEDKKSIIEILEFYHTQFKNGNGMIPYEGKNTEIYSMKSKTKKLTNLFESIIDV